MPDLGSTVGLPMSFAKGASQACPADHRGDSVHVNIVKSPPTPHDRDIGVVGAAQILLPAANWTCERARSGSAGWEQRCCIWARARLCRAKRLLRCCPFSPLDHMDVPMGWHPLVYMEYRHAACRGSLEGTTDTEVSCDAARQLCDEMGYSHRSGDRRNPSPARRVQRNAHM